MLHKAIKIHHIFNTHIPVCVCPKNGFNKVYNLLGQSPLGWLVVLKTYFVMGKVVEKLCYSNWITENQDNCVTDKLKPHITPTKTYLFRIT